MSELAELRARVDALEERVSEVAADATAARHLAAAADRDLGDLGAKVDASRSVINALGEQTAARFDGVDRRFDGVDRRFDGVDRRFDGVDQRIDALEQKVDDGFVSVRAQLDRAAVGQDQIVSLLTQLIGDESDDER